MDPDAVENARLFVAVFSCEDPEAPGVELFSGLSVKLWAVFFVHNYNRSESVFVGLNGGKFFTTFGRIYGFV